MATRRGAVEAGGGTSVLSHERILWDAGVLQVAGVDEVGIGPWAGPVVASAVVFAPGGRTVDGVDDSKKLSAQRREQLAAEIRAAAIGVGVGVVEVPDVDAMGVHRAGLEAMRRAVLALDPPPGHLLIDARRLPDLPIAQSAFVRADSFIYSVAAASIVAKVTRDGIMREMEDRFPGYGFSRHMGYGTASHASALRSLGPCAIHRRSFAPVRRVLSPNPA